MQKKIKILAVIFIALILINTCAFAAPTGIAIPTVEISVNESASPEETVTTLQIIALITILSLAPAILIMMTSFTRIIIILSFLRNALGTQQMPPNQILIGLALFLTLAIMSPTIARINEEAFTPYVEGEISQDVALDNAGSIIKTFMLSQLRGETELGLFMELGDVDAATPEELPLSVVIPAFILSELKLAFQIGFILYIPFLVIDMIVASTLMSMGMMMLPPTTISLPFKILLFVLVDGWALVVQSVINGFMV
ncbi:MAG: flagellar type III secretion system pore protein FliP [Clostridiales bacterium]|nr:flagellar type III secretion system pore protein FliP [Clostridiales bacterium]